MMPQDRTLLAPRRGTRLQSIRAAGALQAELEIL